MITRIAVTNANDETWVLPLSDPLDSGFIVRDISGLGPVKSNINLSENAGISGSSFNSARTPARNIVLTLDFLENVVYVPDPMYPLNTVVGIEGARLKTYQFFPTESRVRFDIETEAGTFYIYGYIESNAPTIFSKSTGTVISIICPDPYFLKVGAGTVSKEIGDIAKYFYFLSNATPSNPPLIPREPLYDGKFAMGEAFFQTIQFNIPYTGTVNVGPTLILAARGGVVENPRIVFSSEDDPDINNMMSFDFAGAQLANMLDGEYLEIVCEPQNKSVILHKPLTGDAVNYLGALNIDSVWPVLKPGRNLFSYDAKSGGTAIRFRYSYDLKFTGV